MSRLLRLLASELTVVVLLGLVSTTTAWTAIQASFHGGASDAAIREFDAGMVAADNLFTIAEVKFRFDLLAWDTDIGGSYEYDTHAVACKERNQVIRPETQLPDCVAYMDAVYQPYNEAFDAAQPASAAAAVEGDYASRLQMLTGVFALALFSLGVTAPMKSRRHAAYLIGFAAAMWVIGLVVLLLIPTILLG